MLHFSSNTTKESTASLLGRLRSIGFEAKEEELYTSLNACKKYVEEHKLKYVFPPTRWNPYYCRPKIGLADTTTLPPICLSLPSDDQTLLYPVRLSHGGL
jgi:hypothetical protein